MLTDVMMLGCDACGATQLVAASPPNAAQRQIALPPGWELSALQPGRASCPTCAQKAQDARQQAAAPTPAPDSHPAPNGQPAASQPLQPGRQHVELIKG